MVVPIEVFSSMSDLPKDPVLRKQRLEELMAKIHGCFSFMQVVANREDVTLTVPCLMSASARRCRTLS